MRFGTDGIRGIFNAGLDANLAYLAGVAAAAACGGGRVLLAMDTRESGRELYSAARDGLLSGGSDVLTLGILPTPALSFLVTKFGAAAGVMITASHNPPEYNGLKFFGGGGLKLSEQEEQKIDAYITNPPKKTTRGRLDSVSGGGLYLEHIAKAAPNLGGVSVVLDCGHGALFSLAAEFFSARAARVKVLCGTPDGSRINCGCGAIFPELAAEYTKKGYDLGFSFDGDGDRLSVSRGGAVLDGDSVLFNLSELTDARTVVGTILSNSALERELTAKGKTFLRTPVGDKYISRLMQEKNYRLGGEQSGHFIIRPHAQTGDALLSAALLAQYTAQNNPLKTLQLTPQKSISKYATLERINHPDIQELIKSAEKRLAAKSSPAGKGSQAGNDSYAAKGRLIVRMSGTEPKMRITAEHENAQLIDEILSEFDKTL